MSIQKSLLLLFALLLISSADAADAHKERILCTCGGGSRFALFLSDPDGQNERPLMGGAGFNYNASFSADGKWVIFTSERAGSADIYRVHPDSSGLERLTDSPSFDDQGALSPDGRTLAFVSTRAGGTANIWLLDLLSHRTVNLTKNKNGNFRPSWSPDGKWIAFTSDRDTNAGREEPGWELKQLTAVYIVHPDGAGLRRLTPLDQFAGSPKWSPDGRNVVYYQAPSIQAPSQIVSVNVETGAQQVHTSDNEWKLSPQYIDATEIGYRTGLDGEAWPSKTALAYTSGRKGSPGQIFDPSWSPDGKAVVYQKYVAAHHAWMEPVFSVHPKYDLLQNTTSSAFPAFSPDGSQVIYISGNKLQIMDADGSHVRDLWASGDPAKQMSPISWSPDGTYIAMEIAERQGFMRPVLPAQIALIRSDGTGLRMLTQGESSSGFPSFSPDGKKLVYRVLGGEQGLRIVTLEDGKITKLTMDWDNFPSWSPRGDRIAFTSLRTGDFEIYTIRPDGSGLRQLTHDHGNDAHSSWSPDGKWIEFLSSRMGWKDEGMIHGPQSYGEIFVMREDGTDVRQLTDNQWEDGPAMWLPDRKQ